MTTATATAQISDLSISYHRGRRDLRVVKNLSLTIPAGGAYGLVGESGCGKTTVAMALMRYLPDNASVSPESRISFDGENLLTASPSTLRRWRGNRIAMVYQNPGSALNPSMLIGVQVAETYRVHEGMSRKEAHGATADMLAKVRIPDPGALMGRYPHQLSGGQQQRVMIAMALATNPDLLVLDEPTTGLDATVEAEVLDLLEAVRAEFSTSILFISHNLGIVARLCDDVGVLYAGQLIEEGSASEVFQQPRHPYTVGLLRSVPREGLRKSVRLASIPGSLPPLGHELTGCPFVERCPISVDACHRSLPTLEPVAPSHAARCFLHEQVPALLQISSGVPASVPPEASGPEDLTPVLTATGIFAQQKPADGSPEVLLEVSNLVKRYGKGRHEVTVVSDVSFHVNRGEVFGLVGESGSGKTTLAKCIVGMVEPTSGTISFADSELTPRRRRNRDIRRSIQMIFQDPDTALNPRRTIGQILGRSLELLRPTTVSGTQEQTGIEELAASVRLEPRHLDVRPSSLSGGLKQRAAIARSFAGSPALVLCDEPVSALDVSVQASILNLLADLQTSKGVSYVFISHDLGVVGYLSDRIGVMYLGQLVEIGPADAVFSAPHHPYTEALMSAVPSLDVAAPQQRIKLEGAYPSVTDPPPGCRFNTRCPRQLGELCRTVEPPWQKDVSGNSYRCHIAPDELAKVQLQ